MPKPRQHLARTEICQRQTERLQMLLDEVAAANPFWIRKFEAAGVEPAEVRRPEDLAILPLTTKAELVEDQQAHPPYGSNLTYEQTAYSRLHQTSGTTGRPLRWLDTPASWDWFMQCWATIFRLIDLQPDDRLFFPFSFGPFIGFWAAFEGAARLGNLCIAGGGMSSEARLQMVQDNQATVLCCTPTYALRLAEVAETQGFDLASGPVRALVVAGEAGGNIPATRERITAAWGAQVFDHWGMTEIGALAAECAEHPGGLDVLETECIAEVLDPQTLQPVSPGETGELVVTNLGRLGSPLIRYRTGDLVRVATETGCPAHGLLRLQGGILGRVDEMMTIRGNNVFPSSLEAILRRIDGIAEYRIDVETRRSMQHMRIQIEPRTESMAEELLAAVRRQIKDSLNFEAEVVAAAPGSLPRFEMKGRRVFKH